MAGLILDHILPIVCLTIDYSFNLVPFMRRHLLIILMVTIIYLIINMLIVKITGNVIYVIFKWEDWSDLILPSFLVILGSFIFIILEFMTK